MTVKNCTNVKEFRQLKKEIRGPKDHLIVDIDVAKDDHRAFFGTRMIQKTQQMLRI